MQIDVVQSSGEGKKGANGWPIIISFYLNIYVRALTDLLRHTIQFLGWNSFFSFSKTKSGKCKFRSLEVATCESIVIRGGNVMKWPGGWRIPVACLTTQSLFLFFLFSFLLMVGVAMTTGQIYRKVWRGKGFCVESMCLCNDSWGGYFNQ